MDPARWRRIEEIFHAASELSGEERARFLDAACNGDTALRSELDGLLEPDDESHDPMREAVGAEAGGYLESSGKGLAIGPYRTVRRLGQGGMGAVYLAERADDQYQKQVAIKLIRAGMEQRGAFVRRFLNERQILASLEHPNIARLLDGGVADSGAPYLVMEYIDGEAIDHHAEARGLGVEPRLRLFLGVCEAVQHAHRHMVIHRDLKPSNIMVDREGRVKLLDFGIARIERPDSGAAVTLTGDRALTPEYASPEMIRGDRITAASDIFSLGVVLYELLTRARPFAASSSSLFEKERAIMAEEARRPSDLESGLVRTLARDRRLDLDAIVARALRKEPAARYESVEAFAADVQRYLGGFPVSARQGDRRYRLRKFVQRHKFGVAAGAVFALTLIASGASLAVFAARAARERDAAQAERLRAERVSGFLASLFASADPRRARGATVTARDLLDQGSRRLLEEKDLPPSAMLRLLETMGQSYQHLGLPAGALRLFERQLEIERRTSGPSSESTFAVMRQVADIERLLGMHTEARARLAEALEGLRRSYPDSPQLAHTLNNLALVESETGQLSRALELQREAVRIATPIPSQRAEVLTMRANLSGLLQETGDLSGAEEEARQVLEMRRAVLGGDHPFAIRQMGRYAKILLRNGAYSEAAALIGQALPLARRVWGEKHADSLQLRAAELELSKLRGAAGAEAWRRFAADAEEVMGPAHRDVLVWRAMSGDDASIEASWGAIAKSAIAKSVSAARIAELHAEALLRRGDRARAVHSIGNAIQIRHQLGQQNHPDLARALAIGGSVESLRRAIDIERKAFRRPHLQLAGHLVALGKLLPPAEGGALIAEGESMRRAALADSESPKPVPAAR